MGAYLHCEHEPGDTSLKALAATMRKRLSQPRESVPPYLHQLQVHGEPVPAQALLPDLSRPAQVPA